MAQMRFSAHNQRLIQSLAAACFQALLEIQELYPGVLCNAPVAALRDLSDVSGGSNALSSVQWV